MGVPCLDFCLFDFAALQLDKDGPSPVKGWALAFFVNPLPRLKEAADFSVIPDLLPTRHRKWPERWIETPSLTDDDGVAPSAETM
jgi:hypothetical protein